MIIDRKTSITLYGVTIPWPPSFDSTWPNRYQELLAAVLLKRIEAQESQGFEDIQANESLGKTVERGLINAEFDESIFFAIADRDITISLLPQDARISYRGVS